MHVYVYVCMWRIRTLFPAMPVYCADTEELFHLSKEMLCFGSVKLIFCLLGLNKDFNCRQRLNWIFSMVMLRWIEEALFVQLVRINCSSLVLEYCDLCECFEGWVFLYLYMSSGCIWTQSDFRRPLSFIHVIGAFFSFICTRNAV